MDCSGDHLWLDDVDTIFCDGVPIRVLGMDGAEILHPEVCMFTGQEYGEAGAWFARTVFCSAKTITVQVVGVDKYKRPLGHVFADGQLYAAMAIKYGYAYQTVMDYGDNGAPAIAKMILKAWLAKQFAPPFQKPHDWRAEHQFKPCDMFEVCRPGKVAEFETCRGTVKVTAME